MKRTGAAEIFAMVAELRPGRPAAYSAVSHAPGPSRSLGTSAHNFILEAIAEKAELAEQRLAFDVVSDQRYAQFLASGESIAWEDARTYLEQRLSGQRAKRPAASKQDRSVTRVRLAPA